MKILRISSGKKLTLIVKDFNLLRPPFCMNGVCLCFARALSHARARSKLKLLIFALPTHFYTANGVVNHSKIHPGSRNSVSTLL